ncbi:hypothetical protein [Sediminibacter sp. Hel_I_10]|uniref:hypothetical protein n=1 Tax=Sediminibacter sp. Hel_I_10 TaxID=1392490 RepID=UPI00047CF76A|nr:hypothetical protein [Sediminibacter sp. Hel_I_10]
MAPIKFEEQLKKKMEERSIKPSEGSWEQLSEQMDANHSQKTKSRFMYLGIAASLVGVLLVSTLFFKNHEEHSIAPTIVDTESHQNPINDENSGGIKNVQDLNVSEAIEKIVDVDNQPKVQSESTQKALNKNKTTIDNAQIASASSEKLKEDKKNAAVLLASTLTAEQAKVLEVVAEIKKLQDEGDVVSDKEIEDLLKKAEREILKQRLYNETTRTVDANALLQDVEDELDQSFRSKVFDALRSSYDTVKTAVAERND